MANLQQQIAEKFLAALAENNNNFDAEKIAQLRQLLMRDKKPAPDEFVQIFTTPVGGEVK